MAGRLAVSVIEARNVDGDIQAQLDFYVKLRLGPHEDKTAIARGSTSPKFLRDIRLEVPDPAKDVLRVELLQVGPRGDLVVGSYELAVAALVAKGTIVHWFELRSAARTVGAELCMVLRYGTSSRPPSPFQGSIQSSSAAVSDQQLSPGMFPQPARAQSDDMVPDISTKTSAMPAVEIAAAAAAPPDDVAAPTTPGRTQHVPATGPSPEPGVAAPAVQTQQQRPQQRLKQHLSKLQRRLSKVSIPTPLVAACGVLLGAVAYMWNVRPIYYEVQEGDTVCSVASCRVSSSSSSSSSRESGAVKVPGRRRMGGTPLADPDVIFPGDRLRLK